MKKIFAMAAFLLSIHFVSGQRSPVFVTDGQAVRGYDVVAFFTESKPVKGSPEFVFRWMDADWLFASKANLDRFKADPEKYAPQYGGYCAYGTAEGHKAPTQIDTWTIADGKLYLNYNDQVKKLWLKDQTGMIRKADQNWPLIRDRE